MATVTIKFQNSLNWYIWFTSPSYQCWLHPLKTQAIFIILAVLVIKRVQRVLPKLHAKRAIIRTLTVTYGTLLKNRRSSVLNLPKQRQVCISVIYGTLSVSCKRVVSVLSPLASNSCGRSQIKKIRNDHDHDIDDDHHRKSKVWLKQKSQLRWQRTLLSFPITR